MAPSEDKGRRSNGQEQNKSSDDGGGGKVFVPCESVLRTLAGTGGPLNTVYRACWVALGATLLRLTLVELSLGRSPTLGTTFLVLGFRHLHCLVLAWPLMFLATFAVYPAVRVWALYRPRRAEGVGGDGCYMWDVVWGAAGGGGYLAVMLYVPELLGPPPEAMVTNACLYCEQVRLLMKSHAFLRETCARVPSQPVPSLSNWMYFLFAPTLLYRDVYPRTARCDWGRVMSLAGEFFCVAVWASLMLGAVEERWRHVGLRPETPWSLAVAVCDAMLPASFFWLSGFYILLHVWLNAWAEMMRFADRRFYGEWWTSEDFGTYYRRWNLVVHEYLHRYWYRDLVRVLGPSSRTWATLVTFLGSVAVHEYLLVHSLGFWMPVLALHFSLTALVVRLPHRTRYFSAFLSAGVAVGTALELISYSAEYYARTNCPQTLHTRIPLPHILSCNIFQL